MAERFTRRMHSQPFELLAGDRSAATTCPSRIQDVKAKLIRADQLVLAQRLRTTGTGRQPACFLSFRTATAAVVNP
jgi:hypothetical protein